MSAGPFSEALCEIRDRVISSDPGLQRLRSAAQTVLSAGLSALVLWRLALCLGKPVTDTLIGVVVAMVGAMVVSGGNLPQPKLMLLLMPITASTAVALGTWLASMPRLSYLVFLAIIFAAVLLRSLGPGGAALGMIAYMAYFLSLFFNASVAQIPWMAASIVVAAVIVYGVRFTVFHDRPPKVLRRGLRALRASVALLLRCCRDFVSTDAADRSIRDLVTRTRQLQDVVLAVQHEIDAVTDDAATDHDGSNEWESLRTRVIELELSLEALVDCVLQMVRQGLSDADRHRVRAALDSVLERVRRSRSLSVDVDGMAGGRFWSRFHRVLHAITTGDLPWETQPGGFTAESAQQTSHSSAPPSQKAADPLQHVKQAVKATLAAGLAILAGHAISGVRWYWAVIAAFIVFTSAETVSEQLVRAWQRVLGTAVGVIAGIVLAEVSGNSPNLDLALIFLLLAAGLYLQQIMYAWFVLALTMMLAILYSFMGRYSPGLLLLRLEETIAGAAIGVVVAVLVFPASSRRKLRGQAAQVVRCASDLLRTLSRDAESNSYSSHFDTQRELQQKVADLRTALAARTTITLPIGSYSDSRLVSRTAALAYCVRHLATAATVSESMRMTAAQTAEITRDLCTIAEALEGSSPRNKSFTALGRVSRQDLQPEANSDWQDRIIASIAGFAVELGFLRDSDEGA